MRTYELIPLDGRPADWDRAIQRYETKTLFHEGAWLDHMLSIHPRGRIDYFAIKDGDRLAGYYCGLRITKLLLPIHGSPLGGTGTNFLGPVVAANEDRDGLACALARLGSPPWSLHLELANPWLDRTTMVAAGFTVHPGVSHVVPLDGGEEKAWTGLKGTCRNRIRKAQKAGLVVERTEDPAVVDEFFAQFTEVYGKQGMMTPFGRERPASLFRHLLPAGRLLPLRVRRDGDVLATGLFPHDDRAIYFWGAASWLRFQHLCPNELLHWEVMRFAAERGIGVYNMCGGGSQFKDKFGGTDEPYLHYSRSTVRGLGILRSWYRRYHFWRLRARPSRSSGDDARRTDESDAS